MLKTPLKLPLFLLVWALLGPIVPSASADDRDKIQSIRYGLKALAFSSGSIQQSTPVEGIVNVVTGDNQTTGDRMIVGQKETIYLRLKNPDEAKVGDYFTVYKRARKVFHPATRQYLGYLIYRLAIVQVVQTEHQLTTVQTIRSLRGSGTWEPSYEVFASNLRGNGTGPAGGKRSPRHDCGLSTGSSDDARGPTSHRVHR